MTLLTTLRPCAPFAGLAVKASTSRGVIASDRDGLGLASVLVKRGQLATLTQRLRDRFGFDLVPGPRRTQAGDIAFAGTGPDAWLASCERGVSIFVQSLEAAIGDLAAVSDLSDSYGVLRLTGPKLRHVLSKIIPLDLHERVFKPGDVASTVVCHMGVTLWRLDDGADGLSIFEIAVFRSLAASFWHTLTESAAAFGIIITDNDQRADQEE